MAENKLKSETSPYLLQHRDNPVWWQPWGDEAFALAKKENKPIFLSIGYSTCHWCHVMEKDSFEKQSVANVLNKNFISIKVDREERPDVDSVYMSAVQAISGRGGWPLSALLLPDGTPFWGGTFLAHDNFLDLLDKVHNIWISSPEELEHNSKTLKKFLDDSADLPATDEIKLSQSSLDQFFTTYARRFDNVYGGSTGAPKFPPALACSLLLRIHKTTGNDLALLIVEKTLREMRRGGIYDQVGGGFHRYSVDEEWLIPHFEKMLYDNALLSQCYLEAYQVTKTIEYANIAREIFNYILRDMTSLEGGFYSAEDADSENIEGKFYVWSDEELESLLNAEELTLIKNTYSTSSKGNFHTHKTGDEFNSNRDEKPALAGNVFFLRSNQTLPLSPEINSILEKLFKVRTLRVRPHLDDKILLSWNGLMISSLAKGFQILEDPKLLKAAQKAAQLILDKFWIGDKLARVFRNGKTNIPALADDYAFFIEGLLNLYQTDFDEKWYGNALKLQEKQNELFWDESKNSFFDNDGQDPNLIVRSKNFEDGVIPSANSVSAHNLLKLSGFSGNLKFKKQAEGILQSASSLLSQYPQASAKMLQVVDDIVNESFEVAVISSKNSSESKIILKELRQAYLPRMIIAGQFEDFNSIKIPLLENRPTKLSQDTFYLCQNQSCLEPLTEIKLVLEKLSGEAKVDGQ